MGLRKLELACFSVLLLMLLQLESGTTPCFADKYENKFSFNGGSDKNSFKARDGFKKIPSKKDGDGDDEIFGGEKRKVYTGPNPLHNR